MHGVRRRRRETHVVDNRDRRGRAGRRGRRGKRRRRAARRGAARRRAAAARSQRRGVHAHAGRRPAGHDSRARPRRRRPGAPGRTRARHLDAAGRGRARDEDDGSHRPRELHAVAWCGARRPGGRRPGPGRVARAGPQPQPAAHGDARGAGRPSRSGRPGLRGRLPPARAVRDVVVGLERRRPHLRPGWGPGRRRRRLRRFAVRHRARLAARRLRGEHPRAGDLRRQAPRRPAPGAHAAAVRQRARRSLPGPRR